MRTDTFTSALKRKVVASDTAESIGAVKGFVLDRRGRRIESIHVDGRGKRASLLAWSAVRSFGVDAVMAASGHDPSGVTDEHEKESVTGHVAMLGARVLTTDGVEAGTVTDVEFDADSGEVLRILTAQGAIDADHLRSLGSYALVVDPAATTSRSA